MNKRISVERLSTLVHQARDKKNLTQEQLGNLTGINRQIIGRIESGKHIPSIEQLNIILEFLHINFNEIIEEKKDEELFLAMMGEAKTSEEKDWFEKMISMLLCIQKHERLRRAYDVK